MFDIRTDRIEGVLRGRLNSHQAVVGALEDLRSLKEQLEALQSGRDSWEKALGNLDAVIATGIKSARAALASLTAHLSRQHELLREAEEAMGQALDCRGPYNGTVSERGGDPAICEKCEEAARSWLARYREQEEGL